MKKKLIAVSVLCSVLLSCLNVQAATNQSLKVNVNLDSTQKEISPYIYGINDVDNTTVTPTAIRQGGNRYSAYNWENNFSNAGSDWLHSSDTYLVRNLTPAEQAVPGACATALSKKAATYSTDPYTIATIQMVGKVSADADGEVTAADAATRFNTVKAFKGSELSLTPDLTDDYVYMDEYVNYLVNTLGDSQSPNGINGYNLDNEPTLWHHTHAFIKPDKETPQGLVDKSIEYASAIKSIDPNAETFGPALFGVGAYNNFSGSEDWNQYSGQYPNYVSFYLDKMEQAERDNGKRLLDVIDVHYYSEAKGGGIRITDATATTDAANEARMQAARSLFEDGYYEDSWIGQWVQNMLPIIPTLNEAIDKYYPGTKLSFTEYNFGGPDHISGTIAEVDALGAFAENNVYVANMWPLSNDFPFIASGINLYTNYDGEGSSFGDTLVESSTSNELISTSYAAIDGGDKDQVTLVLTNKSSSALNNAEISLNTNSDIDYSNATIYGVVDGNSEIVKLGEVTDIKDNKFTYDIPALSAIQVVIDADGAGEEPPYELIGDVNGDNVVGLADIMMVKKYILNNESLTAEEQKRADVNKDNKINSIDTALIKRTLMAN